MSRVLVIDDSILARQRSRIVLETLGHEVTEAPDGATGLEAVRLESFELIILDLLMPGLSGQEVLEELQSAGCRVPIVVVTADAQNQTRTRCLALGAREVLRKYSDPDELRSVINEALAETIEN